VSNEEIRKKTRLQKLELIIKNKTEMAGTRIKWELRGYTRKPGWSKKNWMDIIRRDLKDMDTNWDEAEELATERAEWRQRVAECLRMDTG